MKKVLTVFLVGSLCLLFGSCGSSSVAHVRILNASPNAGTIDVTINGNTVASALAYGTGTNYFTVAPGTNITLKIDNHPVAPVTAQALSTTIGLVDKTYYTVAVVGLLADTSVVPPIPSTFTIAQSEDDHTAPASGDVKIRVLHADPIYHVNQGDSGPVDVYVSTPGAGLNNTPPTFPSVSFQTMTKAVSVIVPTTDGNLQIRVAPAGDTNPDADNLPGWDSQIVLFKTGQIRTYVLLNNPTKTPFVNQNAFLDDLN